MEFYLKSVGKIKSAEFNIKPLTIFIGANDTGKTYATSSIWALCNYINNDFNFNTANINKIVNFIRQRFNEIIDTNSNFSVSNMSTSLLTELRDNINNNIQNKSPKILRDTFRFDGFKNSEIGLHTGLVNLELSVKAVKKVEFSEDLNELSDDSSDDDGFGVAITINATGIDDVTYSRTVRFSLSSLDKYLEFNTENVTKYSIEDDVDRDLIILKIVNDRVIKTITSLLCFGPSASIFNNDIVYIPAARTGIMLALNYFVKGTFLENHILNSRIFDSFKTNKSYSPPKSFTKPIQNFAENVQLQLSERNDDTSFFNSLLPGKIKRQQKNTYHFIPNGMSTMIPLAASSSLVTELAPISILESKIKDGSVLILEEPEAHLHLAAQREMAKTIVRMINRGCTILITTHSDTFLQQLNNLILLKDLDNKDDLLKDFELCEEDIISKNSVAAYEFNCNENNTNVVEIKFGKYGFVAKSLNEVLQSLGNQTLKIVDSISESESEFLD